jgi:phosphohistidine phosphatase SixA
MKKSTLLYLCLVFSFVACKKGNDPVAIPDVPTPVVPAPIITNEELKSELLFVNKDDFQVKTNEASTYYSADANVTVTNDGLIKRITSGEVVAIEVTSKASGKKTILTAIGSTDNEHVLPFLPYHAAAADDANAQYLKGWETLRKLPISGETYAIVMRHSDADNGQDFVFAFPKKTPPADWWKSRDSTLARQLNAAGRARAQELGVIFKDLKLPIAKIYSSEFYRAYRTAELMNLGPAITTDSRLNHPDRTLESTYVFRGLKSLVKEKAINGEMMLITSHQPINLFESSGILPTFPKVSAFNWAGAYFVKITADKSMTYEGAASFGMFKYLRDLRLSK